MIWKRTNLSQVISPLIYIHDWINQIQTSNKTFFLIQLSIGTPEQYFRENDFDQIIKQKRLFIMFPVSNSEKYKD